MASRRNYVTTTEVDELIGSGASTDLQISEAEELIDAYVGVQQKFLDYPIEGRAIAGDSSSLTLQSDQQNVYEIDYLKGCEIEILGGTGAGQRRIITGSTKAGVLTTVAFGTAPDSTSFYRIYQLGKFPRHCDVTSHNQSSVITYYKQIPEMVKRAVAAQVEFMSSMGSDFFTTDKSEKVSERIGDYAYENAISDVGMIGVEKLIAPKAKLMLRGIKSRLGQIVV